MIMLSDGRQLYHTPDPDTPQVADQALIDFWSSATKSLFIVDYSFNLPIFETLLPALQKRGVKVQLVLDRSQSKGKTEIPIINSLKASGIDMVIGTSSMHGIIHDKYTIVDGAHAQYGSFNYTNAAGKEDNFFFIEKNSPVAPILLQIGYGIRQWILDNEVYNISIKGALMNYKDIATRAIKTFIQAFVVFLIGSGINFAHLPSLSDGKKLLLSAGIAAASVVWNTVLIPAWQPVKLKLGLK